MAGGFPGEDLSRIVAGTAGGRRLVVPAGSATRPTSDRTREALFASLISLGGSLDGAAFLDLYAGSGAVGLEAASRGATRVVLVERSAAALRAIRTNVETLALPGVEVRPEPVERMLSRPSAAAYDVVFCDPPYSEGVAEVLDVLAGPGWLEPDAVVVVERATRDPQLSWPDGLDAVQSRRYGDSTLWYGRRS